MLRSSVIYFVVGCGAALLIIGGGLDFSAGAVFTLGGLATSQLLVSSVAWPLAVVARPGVLLRLRHRQPPDHHLLARPADHRHARHLLRRCPGVDALITGGDDVLPLPNDFQQLGQGSVGGVPNVILIAIALGLGFWFLLDRTRFGVNVRALGGNRQAAIGNGLRVPRIDLALYAIAGRPPGSPGSSTRRGSAPDR